MSIQISGINGKMGSYVKKYLEDKYDIVDDGDILIDFTRADYCVDVIKEALKKKKKVISGTTNINPNDLYEIKKYSIENEASFIWVSNFSKGATSLFSILDVLYPHFDTVKIIETHNKSKIDKPSGTAKEYAQRLVDCSVESIRNDDTAATHEIIFENKGEKLTIRHEIFSKEAFMNGIMISIELLTKIDYALIVGLDDFLDLLKIVD